MISTNCDVKSARSIVRQTRCLLCVRLYAVDPTFPNTLNRCDAV